MQFLWQKKAWTKNASERVPCSSKSTAQEHVSSGSLHRSSCNCGPRGPCSILSWQQNLPVLPHNTVLEAWKRKDWAGPWNHAPQFQKAAEAMQCVAKLKTLWEGLERPLGKAIKVKCRQQRRPKDAADARTMGCPPRRAASIQSGAGPKEGQFMLQGATLESWSYFWRPTNFITSPRIEGLYAGHCNRLQCLLCLILVLLWSEYSLLCSESSLLEWKCLLWHSMLHVSCLCFYRNSQWKNFRFSFILRACVYVDIHRPRCSRGSQRTIRSWFSSTMWDTGIKPRSVDLASGTIITHWAIWQVPL